MWRKIEITIDFNGSESQTLSFTYSKKQNGESFSNLTQLVIHIIIVDNLHYNLFQSVKWVQQS